VVEAVRQQVGEEVTTAAARRLDREEPRPAARTERPYLRLERIGKSFDRFVALDEVSLDIARGEFACFIGPSGCGKTTLLRIIAGLERQSAGRIEQAGREISALPVERRDFGIVFQSYALFPNLTVFGNVAYGLSSLGRRRAEIGARVEELLEMVGLAGERGKYPAQLSGGQQQRVAVVRALATSPGLLLLDEPLSALDARVRLDLRQKLKELQRLLGVTTIMVTHDQSEALTIADRIVVMNSGRIEQVGPPAEVYQRPASAFVADFLGTTNFLEGVVAAPGRVRIGAAELACDTAERAPAARVSVALRPENVVVRGVQPGGTNALRARVEALEFNGPFYRARLVFEALQATVLADFSTNAVSDLGISAGEALVAALPPAHLRVLPRG
jgi:iron(III) transport system ATP-binding protein